MDTQSVRKQLRPQENLVLGEGSISSLILLNPTVLDTEDPDVIEAGNYYLPYSTGIELECDQAENYNEEDFRNIPDIMHVQNDAHEQRYRIPPGIKGIVCLYNLSMQLQINNVFTESGNHYHVDCTDLKNLNLYTAHYLEPYSDLIISELETWGYTGTYNAKGFNGHYSSWAKMNTCFNTVEFRIGELTFDYQLLLKRIVHVNAIMRYIKTQITIDYMKDNHPVLKYEEEGSIEQILKNRRRQI